MILMYLCWIKTHAIKRTLARTFNVIKKIVHKWMKVFAFFIQALKGKKVRIYTVFNILFYLFLTSIINKNVNNIFVLVVDATY